MAATQQGGGWLNKNKTYFLITGASRGLGKTLTLKFAPHFGKGSVILLLARTLQQLETLKAETENCAPDVKVTISAVDLSKPSVEKFTELIQSSLEDTKSVPRDFVQAIIIHNAASVGRLACVQDLGDPDEWANYFALNVNSAACLNSIFLKTFSQNDVAQRLIINISSLAAVHPIESAGFYNTGKAARDSLFRTLAKEDPSLTVLTYSPGPLDTEMFHNVRTNIVHPDGKEKFAEIVAKGRLLTCDTTTVKLLDILEKGSFSSGDVIDYFGR